jgi:hypothetical protein
MNAGVRRWPERLALPDDFFVLAHHYRTGVPHLHPLPLGLGIAAALMADLVLSDRIQVSASEVRVVNATPVPDPLAGEVLLRMCAEPGLPLRDWLAFLARTTVEPVAQRLVTSGLYAQEEQSRGRWRRPVVLYIATEPQRAYWRSVRLARMVAGVDEWSVPDVLLAGFVTATSLLNVVVETGAAGPGLQSALQRVQQDLNQLPLPLRYLVDGVQTLVGDAVLSGRT